MGKHTPLPSDPTERAAEKRRRFKAYQKEWKQRRRAEDARVNLAHARLMRALRAEARQLNLELCCSVDDMSEGRLRKAIQTVRGWLR
jgi:hypothetical protein